jgi:flagellar protein FlaG
MAMGINVTGSAASVTPRMDLSVTQSKDKVKGAELERNLLVQPVEEPEAARASREEAPEKLEQVANELSDMMALMRKGLSFKVDNSSGKHVVSVMDVDSGDVIRQIPSEEALKLAEKLSEVTGFLMRTEA